MAFTEALKLKIKHRAHFRCCLCHELFVEIHHIVPEADSGPDTEENAAPLCPSCHETYGANPEKRKFIREARDFWYELCEKRLVVESSQIKAVVVDALKGIATKEDLERLSVQNSAYVLGHSAEAGALTLDQLRYSFTREEYIHPRIVSELKGWLADSYATVVAVDLVSANRSNRFFGTYWVRNVGSRLWIGWSDNDTREEFVYSHIGTSPSGVLMVESIESGGGSGRFNSVLLFAFDRDRALDHEVSGGVFTRERILLKTLGSIALGDRYSGEITYSEGVLSIGPDVGWFQRGEEAAKKIPIR